MDLGGPALTLFCFGGGTSTACPCGNAGTAGNGCASSVNPAGGETLRRPCSLRIQSTAR